MKNGFPGSRPGAAAKKSHIAAWCNLATSLALNEKTMQNGFPGSSPGAATKFIQADPIAAESSS